jgi:hypothetical protein
MKPVFKILILLLFLLFVVILVTVTIGNLRNNSGTDNKICNHDKDCEDGNCCISNICKTCPHNKMCNYDKDCEDGNCCISNICKTCPPLGPTENNLNDPQIAAFIKYLQDKMKSALAKYVKSGAAPSANSNIGLGIYIKNTPGNKGAVKTWWNWQGNDYSKNTGKNDKEPSYYFGSGTKPLTAMMVVGQLYKVWRKKYPKNNVKDFITWYAGNLDQPGSPDAITYGKLFEMTNGFENSNFTETLTRPSNAQAMSTGTSITQTMKAWLFCCQKDGLMTDCASTGIFCNNSCDKICPIALDTKTYGNSCESPFCPASICDWVWYTDYTKKNTPERDPNDIKFRKDASSCHCKPIQPAQYQHIFKNLSIFDVAMMRSGIPDSDSIWGIDTSAQLSSRTSAIGPVQFVSEIIGFDWNPLWEKNTVKENYTRFTRSPGEIRHEASPLVQVRDVESVYTPVTKGLEGSMGPNSAPKSSKYPAAQYSSSAYTFLGILLWLLYDNKNRDDWTKIDLNQLLPRKLRNNINFAGTEGNNGSQYFDMDSEGNRYYSFEKTVSLGNIVHPGVIDGTPIGETQTDMSKIQARVYKRTLPDGKDYNFVDWDSSSGVSCGNGWGKCSEMAEIYMNMFSPEADNPILGDKELQKEFTENFTNYNGNNWEKLWNNKIRAPYCLGANAWGQDSTYNCGVMGPDWFYLYDDPNNDTKYGIIPCYGHLGATYGFNSGHAYFPGGELTGYKPYLEGNYWWYNYSNKEWSVVFDFCGGNEFTISQAHNNSNDDQSGAIQYLVTELLKDPFKWNN